MLVEIGRFRRRFFSTSGAAAMNGVLFVLLLICYAGLVMIVFSSRGDLDPVSIVMFQTIIFILIAPGMLYASIAGEREKRTWDLLLVAPITKAQVVVGKFIGALCGYGIILLAFLLPIFIAALYFDHVGWLDLLKAELVSVTFVVLLSSLTIFFSARSRRALMALGLVLGTLALFLLVLPILSTILVGPEYVGVMNFMHPLFILTQLLDGMRDQSVGAPSTNIGVAWPQIIGYLVLSAVFLLWAIKTLTFAENDVKFLPRPHA
jgi:ABC-type transport system involved in multi-copper enzyme maturation permease subunit